MNKFASLVKSAELYKSATKWKELLRAGQLSTRSLARIMDAAGVKKEIDTTLSPVHQKFTGGGAVKQLSEIVKANPKGLYSKIIDVTGNPRVRALDDVKFKFYGLSPTESYKLARRERDFMSTPGVYRQSFARSGGRNLLKEISQGLRQNSGPDVFDHGMYPFYRELVKDRTIFPSIRRGKRRVMEMRDALKNISNSEYSTTNEIINRQNIKLSPAEALALTSRKEYELAPRRKTHLLSGSSMLFEKDMFKGKSLLEQLNLLYRANDNGIILSPHYTPATKTVMAPLGIGSAITRHEIGHGLFDRGSTAYRIGVIKRIHEMLKRYPKIQKAILQKDPIQLLNELAAQTIAGRGGSRSAQRFIKQYQDYGRNFTPRKEIVEQDFLGHKTTEEIYRGLPFLKDILRKADKLDPSGLDSAMITQLVNNYKLSLPRSAVK